MTLANLDAHTASLNNLRTALRGADAYSGASRMGAAQMAEYARKVQILRADGETVAITAATVDGLMAAEVAAPEAQPEPAAEVVAAEVVAAEPAADVAALLAQVAQVVAKKTAPKVRKPSAKVVGQLEQLLATITAGDDGVIVITTVDMMQAGMAGSYSRQRCGWNARKPAGNAAQSLGYSSATRKDGDSYVAVLTPAA